MTVKLLLICDDFQPTSDQETLTVRAEAKHAYEVFMRADIDPPPPFDALPIRDKQRWVTTVFEIRGRMRDSQQRSSLEGHQPPPLDPTIDLARVPLPAGSGAREPGLSLSARERLQRALEAFGEEIDPVMAARIAELLR